MATKGQEAAAQLKPQIEKWALAVKAVRAQLADPGLKHPLPPGFEDKFKLAAAKVIEQLDIAIAEIGKYELGRQKYLANA